MKNFLFYVGNARAGSTWLYGELNARGDCELGPIKEHFLFQDFTMFPNFNKEHYFGFYQQLSKPEHILLAGDMSPTNAYATYDQLIWYKDKMEEHNFNVLPVMTLRDPIEQVVSLTKLNKTVNTAVADGKASFDEPQSLAAFMSTVKFNSVEVSVDDVLSHGLPPFEESVVPWMTTVENCENVFGKLHINFYEQYFTQESLLEMFEYLKLPYEPMNFSQKVFTFGSDNNLSNDARQVIYEKYPFYKENYQFAIDRFGKEFVESIWWTPNK